MESNTKLVSKSMHVENNVSAGCLYLSVSSGTSNSSRVCLSLGSFDLEQSINWFHINCFYLCFI